MADALPRAAPPRPERPAETDWAAAGGPPDPFPLWLRKAALA